VDDVEAAGERELAIYKCFEQLLFVETAPDRVAGETSLRKE